MNNCINLINVLEKGSWLFDRNGTRKEDFERTEELGHCDLLDTLISFNYHATWSLEPSIRLPTEMSGRHMTDEFREKIERQQSQGFNAFADLKKRIRGNVR